MHRDISPVVFLKNCGTVFYVWGINRFVTIYMLKEMLPTIGVCKNSLV